MGLKGLKELKELKELMGLSAGSSGSHRHDGQPFVGPQADFSEGPLAQICFLTRIYRPALQAKYAHPPHTGSSRRWTGIRSD